MSLTSFFDDNSDVREYFRTAFRKPDIGDESELIGPIYAGGTRRVVVSAPIIRQLVRDGVLRRPPVGLGKAFMDSVKPISN